MAKAGVAAMLPPALQIIFDKAQSISFESDFSGSRGSNIFHNLFLPTTICGQNRNLEKGKQYGREHSLSLLGSCLIACTLNHCNMK